MPDPTITTEPKDKYHGLFVASCLLTRHAPKNWGELEPKVVDDLEDYLNPGKYLEATSCHIIEAAGLQCETLANYLDSLDSLAREAIVILNTIHDPECVANIRLRDRISRAVLAELHDLLKQFEAAFGEDPEAMYYFGELSGSHDFARRMLLAMRLEGATFEEYRQRLQHFEPEMAGGAA